MTPRKRLMGLGAFALASSLVLTACGGGDSGDDSSEGTSTGIVTISNGEPQNPLVGSMTNETEGGLVVQQLYSGLVYYDAEGVVHNEIAESIESDDNQTWTITIQDGWKWSDGTDVTAANFVDAWNWAAYGPNGAKGAGFFDPIEGFTETQGVPEFDEEGNVSGMAEEPTAETLSGLEVVSDTEFTVTLNQPESDFPIRLGYSAYFPLPDAYYDDIEAFGEKPITNGPYVLEDWQHDSEINLVPNEEYNGPRKAQNGGLDFIVYTDENTSYADLQGGNLDILENVPTSAMSTFEEDLGDGAISEPSASFAAMTVPEWLPEFQGEAGLKRRQALSMAINREQITETIFAGTRIPATDFTSPVIDGWTGEIPGNEVTEYNPEEAKSLWDEANSEDPLPDDYVLTIHTNTDSDHQAWVEAVCNGYINDLDIKCEMTGYPTFDEVLNERDKGPDGKVNGLFRAGWSADYPSLQNYLGPLYSKAALAGSNDGRYESDEFDAALKEAAAAPSLEEANTLYNKAQEILFKDLPGIPLWYYSTTAGHSEAVDNVEFGWDSMPLLYEVTKSE
ncbi:ABC transporter substrate-binding protein [Promicromonospora thailandica]|uniref:Oligopeptide transport system substrate-binding protein n=1 Tax=Promicromonospora thailandica TaxID=765201 RepID=A0A9X2G3M5_9MICO|nr:ABC transporter substrate-binding protein [Promicromonospora thailandica]MCP2266234.1 oligopeptide transport system substrate-binding protein [Promicromonospora thailandica]BFF20724.1 ABC transporter substrate-binding protein [Promicromonospora thailandica]